MGLFNATDSSAEELLALEILQHRKIVNQTTRSFICAVVTFTFHIRYVTDMTEMLFR